ncbi:MAG TPA: hypothetical protein VGK47_08190, partial [Nitrososphaeraceae archaeon]
EARETPALTILCGSAWQNRGGTEIQEDFTKYSGLAAISSENTPGSRVITLQTVHDFLRWEQKTLVHPREQFYDIKQAQLIYRLHGPEAMERYRSQFLAEPDETNIPILQIFNTCPILIDTIPMAVYDEKKTEDIAEFDGDDPLDDLRYFCKFARRFINGEIGNIDHQMKINAILAQHAEEQDMTKFYRQMEHLEKQNTIVQAVRRKSGFGRRRWRAH